jgi:F-type H+-transporting ATPase subunit b
MEQTLIALGGLLQKAIPTIILLLILHIYLKYVLFRPLDRVLKQRDAATAGARKAAEESLRRAEEKAAEYEQAIRTARADAYREQEQIRQDVIAQQEAKIQETRKRIQEMVQQARERINAEAEAARRSLEAQAGSLADEITEAVLSGGAG